MEGNQKTFTFALDQEVRFSMSGEAGIIVGRAEYSNAEDSYYVRYVAGDLRQVEAWVSEGNLITER